MQWQPKRSMIAGLVMLVALIVSFTLGAVGGRSLTKTFAADSPTPQAYDTFIKNLIAQHKAPFLNKVLASPDEFQIFTQNALKSAHLGVGKLIGDNNRNVRVNQDHNPWPKTDVAIAVNPLNPRNIIVATNDLRQLFTRSYYHVSMDGGKTWSDDVVAESMNPTTSGAYTLVSNPGVAFDRDNHSIIVSLASNTILDTKTNYANFDTQISLVKGYAGGLYTDNVTTTIDFLPCNGHASASLQANCQGQLDRPQVAVDTNPHSPRVNTIYVYYTFFCAGKKQNNTLKSCTHGNITLPPGSSAILESHAAGIGQPFSRPALVSGPRTQAQFASMVIDSKGVPHVFFDDFSAAPAIRIYEATLSSNGWTARSKPVATFTYLGLNNPHWHFRDNGAAAPGCTISDERAYCAFSASQIGDGPISRTPDVYLAAIDTSSGESTITRVNDDETGEGRDHFFPWAAADEKGSVYVGWYDNRRDPAGVKVEYFVGKSSDEGKTFDRQQAVSDTAFNPCAGFPGCASFGDINQLAIGSDGVVHAAWADARSGAGLQIYTQALKWS
ncbi:MAG: hypothetical protein IMW89_01030 [Ktedonobacteraceae bacterium]|nr:hypothetical protein [Ktedonobacteraceae bacterium]